MEKTTLVCANPYQIDTIKDIVYKFISDGNDVGIGVELSCMRETLESLLREICG